MLLEHQYSKASEKAMFEMTCKRVFVLHAGDITAAEILFMSKAAEEFAPVEANILLTMDIFARYSHINN